MVRKPKASRVEGTVNVSGNSNIPLESIRNMSSPTSLPANKKAAKTMKLILRRSGRIRKLALPVPNQERVVEDIDIADSDRKEEPQIEELNSEPVSSQQNLEEKIDFLVESVQEFKSKGTKKPFSSESQLTELNYKTLYIDSQKKIEALTEENHQLAKELEFAHGKAEATAQFLINKLEFLCCQVTANPPNVIIEQFEQMKDFLGNVKDMVHYSNLGRVTEAVINLSSQATTSKPNSQTVGAPDEPRASSMKKNKDVGLKKVH